MGHAHHLQFIERQNAFQGNWANHKGNQYEDVGEGIEKVETDFAAEVAQAAKV